MNETIKQLLSLQGRDMVIDQLQGELAKIPGQIDALKKQIAENKAALENAKKELTQLQLDKKQKDLDLETKEAAIRKHSTELNAIKSNDAYRALLGEIDKAKQEKSALEDLILQSMEQIDQANKAWKQREAQNKTEESELLKKIAERESRQKELEAQMAEKKADRDQFVSSFPKSLGEQYARLRARMKRSAVVVPIKGVQCSGCHMSVSQNQINEIRRGQRLIVCESCSRVLFLEDVLAQPTK